MPKGLTAKDFGLAIVLAVVFTVAGSFVGQALSALWLGYAGSVVGALYLIVKYMRTEE